MSPHKDEFFGYKHWTLEDVPRCFYVGKGRKNRERSRYSRSVKWKAVVQRYGLRIEVCYGPASDREAIIWEIENIAQADSFTTSYSTLGGTDIMCNFTRGGDGATGYWQTDAMKEHLRVVNTGRKKTPEMIQNLKDNHPMKKPEFAAKMAASKRGKRLGPQKDEHKRKRIEARMITLARQRFRAASLVWFRMNR